MKPNMNRRQFLRSITAGAAMGAMAGVMPGSPLTQLANAQSATSNSKPNFLFLFTDDQTFQSIGSWSNSAVHTPNFDRLTKRGTTFTHCFNMGAWHGAVCVASRAMLNTGRYVWQCGGNGCNSPTGDIYPMWGQTLEKSGYDTFFTGKWHNGSATMKRGFKTIGPTGGGMLHSRKITDAAGKLYDPYNRPRKDNYWSPADTKLAGHWQKVDGQIVHSSKHWADAAINWLEKETRQSDNPFLMYVSFHAPHDPRQSPQKFIDMYPLDKIKIPPNYLPLHPFDPMGNYRSLRDERLAPYPRTKESIKLHLQEYYAIISHADEQIGRILDALEKTGQADNTYIIFTADHGLACGQHGLLGKQNQYDHSVRMPFVMVGPGIKKDKKIDALIYMQSLFATTCDIAKIKAPDTVQFPSLLPLLQGKTKKLYDSIYGTYMNQQRMIRTPRYKLIRYPIAKEVQLFDLKNDPWEMTDLAEDPKYAATVKDLDAELNRWMKRTGDPLDWDNPKKMRLPWSRKKKK